jgi:uncharacterized protein YqfA (UPF0365 family)
MISTWVLVIAAMLASGGLVFLFIRYFLLWLRAYVTGTQIGFLSLILMSCRKVDPRLIVECKMMSIQARLANISTAEMEAHYLAGGDISHVTLALIAADRAGVDLNWSTAAAIDLAGRDILEAVENSVTPKVIPCPLPDTTNNNTISGVAKDGVQLKVRVLVTVRTALSRLIGGATESTVIARVGEGIVSAIGSCCSYRDVLADPQLISRQIAAQGLDSQTSFAIVSIDILAINVGMNIGAKLRLEQANADIRIARAAAETRRAMAIARTQEMLALTSERQAGLILAESQLPPALAAAFRAGRIRAVTSRNGTGKSGSASEQSTSRKNQSSRAAPEWRLATQVEAWETEGGKCRFPDTMTERDSSKPSQAIRTKLPP